MIGPLSQHIFEIQDYLRVTVLEQQRARLWVVGEDFLKRGGAWSLIFCLAKGGGAYPQDIDVAARLDMLRMDGQQHVVDVGEDDLREMLIFGLWILAFDL